jgi:hypothetical protein
LANITTIILFFIYTWGLGFTATYYLKKPDNFLEKHFLNIAVGLGIIPILTILMNFLHVPLDWRIILLLSLIFPVYILVKTKKLPKPTFKIRKSDFYVLAALLIALVSLYIYASGAFSYPYLENEDPWGHSVGVKYVSIEKNAYDPPLQNVEEIDPVLSYIDPYPPAYDILIGILHQTSPSLTWTLKFFNALIISLGFLFFYLFARRFTGSMQTALFATFVLAAIPSYFSHFIWAHSLVVTIFFPAMYAFEMSREDNKWLYVALILTASIWVSQNFSQPLKLTTMISIYLVVLSLIYRKVFWKQFLALGGGILLSFIWWGVIIKKYTLSGFLGYFGAGAGNTVVTSSGSGFSLTSVIASAWQTFTNPTGSASRSYTFDDFFYAKSQNMINNPIGVGVVLSILTLIGLVYLLWHYRQSIVKPANAWRCVAIFWLIFGFWGVNGETFPISVARGAFRVWMLMAIPLALVATEGYTFIKNFFGRQKIVRLLILLVVVYGIIQTSGMAKYDLNTAAWPTSGSFLTQQTPVIYGQWFNSIPDDTKVFIYSPRDKLTIGFGKMACPWCQNVIDFRSNIVNTSAQELSSFLKANNYEYLLLNGPMDARYFRVVYKVEDEQEVLQKKYDEIFKSGLFTPVFQAENVIALRVN